MTKVNHKELAGFTLLEVMITVAILSIVVSLAMPNMQSFFDAKRLVGAAEEVYQHVQQARLEAIKRSQIVYVNFSADGTNVWSYGISTRDDCDLTKTDPTVANACVLIIDDGDNLIHADDGVTIDTADLVLSRFTNAGHDEVKMNAPVIVGGGAQFDFDPLRGIENNSGGSVTLVSGDGKQLRFVVGALGQLSLCTPDNTMPGYSGC